MVRNITRGLSTIDQHKNIFLYYNQEARAEISIDHYALGHLYKIFDLYVDEDDFMISHQKP